MFTFDSGNDLCFGALQARRRETVSIWFVWVLKIWPKQFQRAVCSLSVLGPLWHHGGRSAARADGTGPSWLWTMNRSCAPLLPSKTVSNGIARGITPRAVVFTTT